MGTQATDDSEASKGRNNNAPASAGGFTNRRQKNLQKFRRHYASQRQTSDGKPTADANTGAKAPNNETVETSSSKELVNNKSESDIAGVEEGKSNDDKSVSMATSDDKSVKASISTESASKSGDDKASSVQSVKSDDRSVTSAMSTDNKEKAVKAASSSDSGEKLRKSERSRAKARKPTYIGGGSSKAVRSVSAKNNHDKTAADDKASDSTTTSTSAVGKPEKTAESETSTEEEEKADDGNKSQESQKQAPLSPASSGPTVKVNTSAEATATTGTPTAISASSPHTSKRRTDIIKKLTNKKRQNSADSPVRDVEVNQSGTLDSEEGAPPLVPVMTDSTNNSKDAEGTGEKPRSSSKHRRRRFDKRSESPGRRDHSVEVKQSRTHDSEDGTPPLQPAMTDGTNNSKESETNNGEKAKMSSFHRRRRRAKKTEPTDGKLNGSVSSESLSVASADSKDMDRSMSSKGSSDVQKTTKKNATELKTNISEQLDCDSSQKVEMSLANDDQTTLSGGTNFEKKDSEIESGAETEADASQTSDKASEKHSKVEDGFKTSAAQETREAEATAVETSSSFDLRSIHDFPTQPIAEASASLPPRDPSWDTAKVVFNEFQHPNSTKSSANTTDAINVFDTSDPMSWGTGNGNEIAFSDVFETNSTGSGTAQDNFFVHTKDEKKELDPLQQLLDRAQSPASTSSPHRSSRMQANSPSNHSSGFDMSSVEDENEKAEGETEELTPADKDDENLLAGGDCDGEVWVNKSQPSKEERLQQYTSSAPGDDNSSQSSSKEEEPDDESSHEPPDVAYVEQMEEKKEEEVDTNPKPEFDAMPFPVVDEAPAFMVAAQAAAASSEAAPSTNLGALGDLSFPAPSESKSLNFDPMVSLSESSSNESNGADGTHTEGSTGYISKSSSSSTFLSAPNGVNNKQPENEHGEGDCGLQYSGSEPFDLEESSSLVGVSLVPSFGASNSKKVRDGMPPKSGLSPSMLPPPPPPPLSKRKKKKKKRKGDSKKEVPLLAPPSEEKLKKWLHSSEKATHLGLDTIGIATPKARNTPNKPKVEEVSCGPFSDKDVWEPAESPGRIKLSCGDYSPSADGAWATAVQTTRSPSELSCAKIASEQWDAAGTPQSVNSGQSACVGGISDALAMAGLNVSPSGATQCSQGGPTPSPVDAARSIALENAMRRANQGSSSSSRFDFGPNAREADTTKSLFENEGIASTSMENSVEDSKSPHSAAASEPSAVAEPPQILRTDLHSAVKQKQVKEDAPVDASDSYLKTLTSPSLSMSPSNNGKKPEEDVSVVKSPTMSPIIHDTKMAEKVALASHAAAVTFEEKYSAARNTWPKLPVASEKAEDSADMPSLFCAAPEIGDLQNNIQNLPGGEEAARLFFGQDSRGSSSKETLADLVGEKTGILKDFNVSSPSREDHGFVRHLSGGAFSPWRNGVYARKPSEDREGSITFAATSSTTGSLEPTELVQMHKWLTQRVLQSASQEPLFDTSDDGMRRVLENLLHDDEVLNKLCDFTAAKVNIKIEHENEERAKRNAPLSPRKKMRPFTVGRNSTQKSSAVVAANFVSFIHRVSKASGQSSPFGEDNPFLLDLVTTSIHGTPKNGDDEDPTTMQRIVFRKCPADKIVIFCSQVCSEIEKDWPDSVEAVESKSSGTPSFDIIEATRSATGSKKHKGGSGEAELGEQKYVVPDGHPSPFERLVQHEPKMLAVILDYLGDPVAVCRMKMTSKSCKDFVSKNEQVLMRDAVRLGGLSMHVRPSFWLWVILEKCSNTSRAKGGKKNASENRDQLMSLEEAGRSGKYHNVIQRDVARAFGNMPPHKTGSRLRTDSIVRALVTWGKNRIMKRGVKGDGNPPPSSGRFSTGNDSSESEASQTRTDTVSDWGGVSPVASFAGSCNGASDGEEKGSKSDDGKKRGRDVNGVSTDLLVLGGNALTDEMKADLQNKLAFILHALAATHVDVGYCQGMDYVVAHLLRILQETVCWRAAHGTLPASILSAPHFPEVCDEEAVAKLMEETDNTLVVEETIYRVMDCLFTTFNLQHMYWPELRCLKTCCRVFERLIQLKLPVLADHFEHHELNVGLFALGWFQTLFLYLPSMPSATVCHIWDIWLVERSFKIFFRVGTAILFLSQPILLNHELEGMMTYLNTFPDATLLNPDILIACALQIKVTNKMLMEIEESL